MKSPTPDIGTIDTKKLSEELRRTAEVLAYIADPERLDGVVSAIRTGDHDAFHDAALKPFPLPPILERTVCFTPLAAMQSLVATQVLLRHWYWSRANPFGYAAGDEIGTTSSADASDRERERLYEFFVSQGWAYVTFSIKNVRELLPIAQLQVACLSGG